MYSKRKLARVKHNSYNAVTYVAMNISCDRKVYQNKTAVYYYTCKIISVAFLKVKRQEYI